MDTYDSAIRLAKQKNTVRCLVERETSARFSKMNVSLNTRQPYAILVKNQNGPSAISVTNCPTMREADSLGFSRFLYRSAEPVNRCRFCTRALHPLYDKHKIMCQHCRQSA